MPDSEYHPCVRRVGGTAAAPAPAGDAVGAPGADASAPRDVPTLGSAPRGAVAGVPSGREPVPLGRPRRPPDAEPSVTDASDVASKGLRCRMPAAAGKAAAVACGVPAAALPPPLPCG
eukprot:31443-Chlamydomonas_euryale.AAC.1